MFFVHASAAQHQSVSCLLFLKWLPRASKFYSFPTILVEIIFLQDRISKNGLYSSWNLDKIFLLILANKYI